MKAERERVARSKITSKAQTVPRVIRGRSGRPGGILRYRTREGVLIDRWPDATDDPFSEFSEWSGAEDDAAFEDPSQDGLPGDVVVVPFPYADLLAEKRRPAVVVSAQSSRKTLDRSSPWWHYERAVVGADVRVTDLTAAGLNTKCFVRPAVPRWRCMHRFGGVGGWKASERRAGTGTGARSAQPIRRRNADFPGLRDHLFLAGRPACQPAAAPSPSRTSPRARQAEEPVGRDLARGPGDRNSGRTLRPGRHRPARLRHRPLAAQRLRHRRPVRLHPRATIAGSGRYQDPLLRRSSSASPRSSRDRRPGDECSAQG